MKLHKEHKIAIGFAVLAAGTFFGYQAYAAYAIDNVKFAPLRPGRVNLIGVDAGGGYRIIVSNQIAQLVQASDDEFEAPDFTGSDSSNQKRRVPLREMLQALQGDEVALGKFLTGMNEELRTAEMPTHEVVWTGADVQKALDGDASLRSKLEKDLNMRLDGNPLDQIRMKSIQNGIVLKCLVPIEVIVEGEKRALHGEVSIPYRPRFIVDLEKRYQQQFDLTPQKVQGYYLELAAELEEAPNNRENIVDSLKARIDPKTLQNRYTPKPLRDLLAKATVLLNDSFMLDASFSEQPGPEGKPIFDVRINVSDEGRQRLWQFSRKHRQMQLLLVVDGIAIAAPKIRGELTQPQVTIRQIPDRGLVEDAVELINSLRNNP